jgi:hypothetical protein
VRGPCPPGGDAQAASLSATLALAAAAEPDGLRGQPGATDALQQQGPPGPFSSGLLGS